MRIPALPLLVAGALLVAVGGAVTWRAARQPPFNETGTFVLDPRDGHPMVCSSGKRIHFNWDGEPLAITRGGIPPGEHQTQFKRYYELTNTVQLANKQIEVDGDVIATALSPTAPTGWQRCMAVTIGKGRRERTKHRGGGENATTEVEYWWDECYAELRNYSSGEVLSSSVLMDKGTAALPGSPDSQRYLAYIQAVSPYFVAENSFAIVEYTGVEYTYLFSFSTVVNNVSRPGGLTIAPGDLGKSGVALYTGPGSKAWFLNTKTGGIQDLRYIDGQGQLAASYYLNQAGLESILSSINRLDLLMKQLVVWGMSMAAGVSLAFIWHFLLPNHRGMER